MKYQQLENLEAGWKWAYVVKKHKEGANVTRYIDTSEAQAAVNSLLSIEHEPTKVIEWITEHMSPDLDNKLKQAIRAKRKRHFNAEQEHTRKKSIDLDFRVWEKLSMKAQDLDATLSDTIEYLLGEANRSQNANKKVDALKKDLSSLLDM
ncbi:Ter macrodomain-binding protein MatP [Enterovibrio norvegicus]|uniref:macrodomain Ter protein MatP n=1 Tax=Enterovibrio norvegicus TaxID=188144 RepID=UPI000C81BD03|nr:macrodomain Ter protein MatP [Enterovibrio norvegicus]MCC4796959.1 macrodomain Ter protein MatP [Enterovibrio norvegicus]PMH65380.1 Ter macrodomain-binding protein MatP [Enterovibrio norvegicus]PMI26556.1 Ter macrodomain-binding protein MatP [Enterovibrio norvegicus]PMI40696.1 Ter macrodomain-binding protein MatP [Enterovibrio norvegicus]PMN56398.1 Ter macrodomain-binding protein MatP [Enterovibrio norvegicus]